LVAEWVEAPEFFKESCFPTDRKEQPEVEIEAIVVSF
jgi:hypothetical protein